MQAHRHNHEFDPLLVYFLSEVYNPQQQHHLHHIHYKYLFFIFLHIEFSHGFSGKLKNNHDDQNYDKS